MLKIVTLVENTAISPTYRSKHGLCIYIETLRHKILFDLGQDNLFIENANKKNIDISEIDTVIISHGHKDHGGALKQFMALNSKAKIYVKREAFEPHYIKVLNIPINVGLDKELLNSNQIVLTDKETIIDEELFLFSNVKTATFFSNSNNSLFVKRQGQLVSDDFSHEQNLIITIDGEKVLITGCSHAGIIDIQNQAEVIASDKMSTIIGGFHLYNPPTKRYESNTLINSLANVLKEKGSVYYTCHCTGIKAYKKMRLILEDKLHYLSTGEEVVLNGKNYTL